ncbi:ribonuclease Z [Cytophagaceae bacterium ABcell3]|nr:ribonuclease Z [Cytophagaceae bacterium ABcell3]
MSFEIKILGSSSATPVYNRNQTAQIVTINGEHFLIDCGESTQVQLMKFRIKSGKINYIFISHLHGDHFFGLIGLLSTLHLHGRTKDLYIFGPAGLDEIITLQLKYSESNLNYKIIFQVLDPATPDTVLDLDKLTVSTIPLQHRVHCCGFLFQEKPKKRRIDKEKLPENLSLLNIANLKKGLDLQLEDGSTIKNEEVTLPPKKSRSYAYCSDTIYNESIIPLIQGVDVLYHESTFLHDMLQRAEATYHTTALQAATIAQKAKVGKLLLGHYSARYKDLRPFQEEARTVFPKSYLSIEGESHYIEE